MGDGGECKGWRDMEGIGEMWCGCVVWDGMGWGRGNRE